MAALLLQFQYQYYAHTSVDYAYTCNIVGEYCTALYI